MIPAVELSGADLNRPVRVETAGVTLEGVLTNVTHGRKLVHEGTYAVVSVRMPDGRTRVETVGGGTPVTLGDTPVPTRA